jgi:hypothetical protein
VCSKAWFEIIVSTEFSPNIFKALNEEENISISKFLATDAAASLGSIPNFLLHSKLLSKKPPPQSKSRTI